MTQFSVTILGNNSAIPALGRNPSAQLVNINEKYYLIDCAEGTQLQFRKYHLKFQRVDTIFISHLHGDHYFGLIGLLSTMHLMGRNKKVSLFGPKELINIIQLQLKASKTVLSYPLNFYAISPENSGTIFENKDVKVSNFPLKHRIPTNGFLFKEKIKERNIKKEVIQQYNIPFNNIPKIKQGEDFSLPDGTVIKNEEMTLLPPPLRSFAYCSDTAYFEDIIPHILKIDLLYHEATFMHDKANKAIENYHSTAKQAAQIAKKAGVKRLIIGHFSSRYKELRPLLNEAKEVFENTELAIEGEKFKL